MFGYSVDKPSGSEIKWPRVGTEQRNCRPFTTKPLTPTRSGTTRDGGGRTRNLDENSNNVASPSRGGLAGKLQQLLTPTRHRSSVRRAASVDDRRGGGGGGGGAGGGRRVSEQRQSRKAQVAETLLRAKERLVNATSEVRGQPGGGEGELYGWLDGWWMVDGQLDS